MIVLRQRSFSRGDKDKEFPTGAVVAGTGLAAGTGMFLGAGNKIHKLGKEYIKNNPSATAVNPIYNKPIFEVNRLGVVQGRGTEGMKHMLEFRNSSAVKNARRLGTAGSWIAAGGLAAGTGIGIAKAIKKKKTKKEDK